MDTVGLIVRRALTVNVSGETLVLNKEIYIIKLGKSWFSTTHRPFEFLYAMVALSSGVIFFSGMF